MDLYFSNTENPMEVKTGNLFNQRSFSLKTSLQLFAPNEIFTIFVATNVVKVSLIATALIDICGNKLWYITDLLNFVFLKRAFY